MPYFSTEIDIDVDDFLSECSSEEIQELIKNLQEEGHISKDITIQEEKMNLFDVEWLNITNKLNTLRLRLSHEEEELIKNIVNRY